MTLVEKLKLIGRFSGKVLGTKSRNELPYMLTHTGRKFRHTAPHADDICLEDIAHSLSLLCRFVGQIKKHYSVAEHSVHVSNTCEPKDALAGLLHDASEGYCSDLCSPLKRLPGLEGYRVYEKLTMDVICDKFGLSREEPASVKQADWILLRTEQRDLFIADATWATNKGEKYYEPLAYKIVPWGPKKAEKMFLARFKQLAKRSK